ncbi:MAG: hypothetical protein AB7I18_06010 [Candidatus Berkiella sp.]
MKKMSKIRALSNLLLLSALLTSGTAMAIDGSEAIVAAINQMNADVSSRVDKVNSSVEGVRSEVSSAKDVLNRILGQQDITNKEMVNALINYEAKSAVNKYAMQKELLFQVAPGSLWAANAGAQAGVMDNIVTTVALTVATKSLVNSLAMLMQQDQPEITIFGIPINLKEDPPIGYMTMYSALEDFFKTGNPEGLKNINVGGLLQSTVINESVDPKTKQVPSQTIVNLLTNPFPTYNADLAQRLKTGALEPRDKEDLGRIIGQYALMGVSANAWADIIARRTPPSSGDGKSVMQIMQQTAKDRFTSKDWYAAIGTASETALLREMTHMMAYNQWVQYQQFRMQEQQVSLLASINGVMAKLNVSIDQMTQEMEKARQEAKEQAAKAEAKAEEAKKEAERKAKEAQEAADAAKSE